MAKKNYDSLSDSILSELKSVKKEVQCNRLKKANGVKSSYRVPKLNVPYHGLISNVSMDELYGDIEVEVRGYQYSVKPSTRKLKFNTNSPNIRYYHDICNTLGTSGDPSELIGKYIEFHLEQNKEYVNLRIDREESEDEFVDYLSRIENGLMYDMEDNDSTVVQRKNIVHRHKRVSGTISSETVTPKKKKRKEKAVAENVGDIADDLSDFD